jgi:hypothetical protein
MQDHSKARAGVFYPQEVAEMQTEFERVGSPTDSKYDREAKAAAILRRHSYPVTQGATPGASSKRPPSSR